MGPRVGPGPSIHSPPFLHAVRSWTYESRLIKYAKRGYAIAVPGLDWDSVPSKLGGRQAEPAEEPIPEPPSDHYLENPFRINPAYTEWQQQYGTEYHRRRYRSEDDGMYEYFEASASRSCSSPTRTASASATPTSAPSSCRTRARRAMWPSSLSRRARTTDPPFPTCQVSIGPHDNPRCDRCAMCRVGCVGTLPSWRA